jgi:CheY-like chemotaxis protein
MAQPLALLIEDDRFTAQVVLDWLCEAGWRVTRAVNGTEGLRRFSEARPDLVICDILLPGIDGATVCTNVRMQPYGDRVRWG